MKHEIHEHPFKSIFWPLFIEVLFFSMMGLIDFYMLHHLGDPVNGSISTAVFLFGIIGAVVNIFPYGSFALITQLAGGHRYSDAQKTLKVLLSVNTLISALTSIAVFFLARPLLSLFISEPASLDGASLYLEIVSLAYIPFSLTPILGHYLRAFGHDRSPMFATVTGVLLTILGNVLSIYVFPWGLTGVAVSTVVSYLVNFIIHLICAYSLVKSDKEPVTIRNKEIIGKSLLIGGFAALEPLIHTLGIFFMARFVLFAGEESLIVFEVIEHITVITYVTSFALAHANAVKIGFAAGRGEFKEVFRHTHKIAVISLLVSFSLGLLLIILSTPVSELFLNLEGINHYVDAETYASIVKAVSVILFMYIFIDIGQSAGYVLVESSIMVGDTVFLFLTVFLSFAVLAIGLGWFLGIYLNWGVLGFFIALGVEEAVKSTVLYFRLKSLFWTKYAIVKAESRA